MAAFDIENIIKDSNYNTSIKQNMMKWYKVIGTEGFGNGKGKYRFK